jgi:phosphohistidine phosphatase
VNRELLLVRHAVAVERRIGRSDESRPLTAKGRRELKAAVKALKRAGVRIDRLYHSPLLRAVQTADVLAKILDGESEVLPALAEPPGEALLRRVAGRRPALVGHEPWLSTLLAWLVTGKRAGTDRFRLPKGGVVRLVGPVRPGKMSLAGFWDPEILARLQR